MTAQDWLLVLAALLGVGASVAAMAVGVMMRRPCLRGSCGGRPSAIGIWWMTCEGVRHPRRTSTRPSRRPACSRSATVGWRRSVSMKSTRAPVSAADTATFQATVVLPSPGVPEVTSTDLMTRSSLG